MSKRIWIDMTDLRTWNGHMTGIQRVVYLNAERFYNSPDYDAHFFAFNDTYRVFEEVDFAQIREDVERARDTHRDVTDDAGHSARRSLKQLLKAAPRAVVGRIPAGVREKIPPEIKQGMKGGYRLTVSLLRRSKQSLARRLHPVAPPPKIAPVVFSGTDTVLILGKSWDFVDMIPTLGRLKQKQHFTLVHLVHDMIPTLQPHCFGPGLFEPYTKTMFEVCALSDGLLAQSKATAKDIARFCDELLIVKPPIKTVRLGDEILDIAMPANEPSPHPRIKRGNFILQVGTVEARKNHMLVYLAYREAALRGIKLPTWVIVGSQGWLVGDLLWQIEHDPAVKDNIVYLGGVSDRVRLWLARNCRYTVYPSTYEGFGMPVSESLAYGKVCITSKTSSLPEAGAGFADLVSPYNTEEMLQAMVQYNDDAMLKKRESEVAKYVPSTWDEMFATIASFVDKLSTKS